MVLPAGCTRSVGVIAGNCETKSQSTRYSLGLEGLGLQMTGALLLLTGEISKHKGPPVFNELERYKMVRAIKWVDEVRIFLGHLFFIFLFYQFFSQQVRVGGRNKNENRIHSDHFPIKLKSKETRFRVSFDFNSIGKWSE